VSATLGERVGVIVVRVWVETDGQPRARVTATTDVSTDDQTVSSAEGVEGIVAAVRSWLERFVGPSPAP